MSSPQQSNGSAPNILEVASTFFAKSTSLVGSRPKVLRSVDLISSALAVAGVGVQIGQYIRKSRNTKNFNIKIRETDMLFGVVERWMNESLSDENKRNLLVSSRETSRDSSNGSQTVDRDLSLHFDGTIEQDVVIEGHRIHVQMVDPGSAQTSTPSGDAPDEPVPQGVSHLKQPKTINLGFNTREGRDAFVEVLHREIKKIRHIRPGVYSSSQWGGFRRLSAAPARSSASVILKRGQMERLLNHVKAFYDNEDAYTKIGVPYHTGILLYGIPGTGKTSTAKVIAHEMGLNVYIISLSNLSDDSALTSAIEIVPPYSVIVFEDVDAFTAVRRREPESNGSDDPNEAVAADPGSSGKGVTIAGVLNALDGITTPHGVVKILTTNYPDKLDSAITRPGRVDLSEELGALDDFQLRSMCEFFMGFVPKALPSISPVHGITAAQISGICRKYVPDFQNAAAEVLDFVESKVGALQTV